MTLALNRSVLPGLVATLTWVNAGENGWFIPWLVRHPAWVEASRLLMGGGFSVGTNHWNCNCLRTCIGNRASSMRGRELRSHRAFFVAVALPIFLFGFFYASQKHAKACSGSYRSYKITSTFTAFRAGAKLIGRRPGRFDCGRFEAAAGSGGNSVAVCCNRSARDVAIQPIRDLTRRRKNSADAGSSRWISSIPSTSIE